MKGPGAQESGFGRESELNFICGALEESAKYLKCCVVSKYLVIPEEPHLNGLM